VFDIQSLIEKLRRVEALHGGATTPGEREAAANAMRVLQARLHDLGKQAPPVEYHFSMVDTWSRRLFVALARRYGLTPYRYPRQRRNTVMLKVSKPSSTRPCGPNSWSSTGPSASGWPRPRIAQLPRSSARKREKAEERPEQRALPAG